MPPNVAMEVAFKMVEEWQKAQEKNQTPSLVLHKSEQESPTRWKCPHVSWQKVNIDASVYEGCCSFKIGMVLKDDRGRFNAGVQSCMSEMMTSMEAEAITVYEALRWIESMGLQNVLIECDALNVVSALLKGITYFSEVGSILDSCRHIL
ncbi:uncharacterized protein LOC141680598 [Apium graveolens]|uniref:uncharacterized protein LOC141680598 n=1 Tax=Apium graveolens TaxID=4045 RepID=UPI003D7B9425